MDIVENAETLREQRDDTAEREYISLIHDFYVNSRRISGDCCVFTKSIFVDNTKDCLSHDKQFCIAYRLLLQAHVLIAKYVVRDLQVSIDHKQYVKSIRKASTTLDALGSGSSQLQEFAKNAS